MLFRSVAVSTASTVYLLKNNSAKYSLSDTKILAEITSKMTFNKKRSNYANLHINVDRGRVLISGYVKDKKILANVKKLVWKTKGVKEVMSEVTIAKVNRNYLSDMILATRIKSKLMMDNKVTALNIDIEVYNKEVYLLGHTNSNEEIRHAAKIASKVSGVRKVVSYLRTNSAS